MSAVLGVNMVAIWSDCLTQGGRRGREESKMQHAQTRIMYVGGGRMKVKDQMCHLEHSIVALPPSIINLLSLAQLDLMNLKCLLPTILVTWGRATNDAPFDGQIVPE